MIIMGAISAYTILNLYRLNEEVSSIFNTNRRLLDIKKNLSDSILSQLEYEKKYAITKDIVFYNQFRNASKTFDKYIAEAMSISGTLPKNDSLEKVKTYYNQYQSIAREELDSPGINQPRQVNQPNEGKEKIINSLLEELRLMEVSYRQDIDTMMNNIRDEATYAGRLAAMMLVIAFFLVIAISFLSTRSITKPLRVLVEKTKEISEGIFEGNLEISSPPEVFRLSRAVNAMCERLKRVDAMKSDFFSAMSHELRTPLTSIKQGIVLLQQGFEGREMSDRQKKLITILSQETNRLIEMVNSLLDLSKMEAGMMIYNFHQEKLPPLIQKVITEMAPLMEAKKIRPRIVISQEIPPLNLDRERMLQVIRNLIGNAIKYTSEGGQISISAYCKDRKVECAFKDTGPGIPKGNLNEIFEKFHQLPVKTSEWSKGTGLGLAFVKHIITAHGGKVWAESILGQGSTFIFTLPF